MGCSDVIQPLGRASEAGAALIGVFGRSILIYLPHRYATSPAPVCPEPSSGAIVMKPWKRRYACFALYWVWENRER